MGPAASSLWCVGEDVQISVNMKSDKEPGEMLLYKFGKNLLPISVKARRVCILETLVNEMTLPYS